MYALYSLAVIRNIGIPNTMLHDKFLFLKRFFAMVASVLSTAGGSRTGLAARLELEAFGSITVILHVLSLLPRGVT